MPSDEDVSLGRIMSGPDGRTFNSILRAANLERDDYMITNVFDEVPEDEADPLKWMKDEVRVAEAFARLNEELTANAPTVIVPLGGIPLWAFTEQTAIKGFRGAVTAAVRVRPGAKLVPTFHPRTVRKNWIVLTTVIGDVIKAYEEAELGPQITYPHVELLIEPTLQDVLDFVPEALAAPLLSPDIETGWGQITSIAFAVTTSRALAVPFVDLRKPNKSYWATADEEFAAWQAVKQMLEGPNPKVGQNYMYDLYWLYMRKGIATRNYRRDTRLEHKVLFPELPADLANMSATYTRVGSYKMWGGRYQKATEKKDG